MSENEDVTRLIKPQYTHTSLYSAKIYGYGIAPYGIGEEIATLTGTSWKDIEVKESRWRELHDASRGVVIRYYDSTGQEVDAGEVFGK